MVKRVDLEAMIPETEQMNALKNETQRGLGTPIERRMADALLENAENMERYSYALNTLLRQQKDILDSMNKAYENIAEVTQLAESTSRHVESFNHNVVTNVKKGVQEGITQSFPPCYRESAKQAEQQLAKVSHEAELAFSNMSKMAEEWHTKARVTGLMSSLILPVKVLFIGLLIGMTILLGWFGWRVLPLATGQVEINYSEEYETDLDRAKQELEETKAELELAQAELDAPKDA